MSRCQPSGNYKNPKHLIVLDQPSTYDIQWAKKAGASAGILLNILLNSLQFDRDDCLITFCASDNKSVRSVDNLRQEFRKTVGPWLNKPSIKHVVLMGNQAVCGAGLLPGMEGVSKLESKRMKLKQDSGRKVRTACMPSLYMLRRTPSLMDSYIQSIARSLNLVDHEKFECDPIDITRPSDVDDLRHTMETAKGLHRNLSYDHETTGLAIFPRGELGVAKSVMTAYYNGVKDDHGVSHPYVWAPYDECRPRFSSKIYEAVKKELRELHIYQNTRKDKAGMWAHNRIFDDPISYYTFNLPRVYWSRLDGRFLSWLEDSASGNGLKDLAYKLFGVKAYDKPVLDCIKAVIERRKGELCEADLRALEFIGIRPKLKEYKNGTQKLLWPNNVVKKMETAYACVPLETLRLYCGFDVIFTWHGITALLDRIKDAGGRLMHATKWKHRFAESLHEAQMRGMHTDRELLHFCSKQLSLIEDTMMANMLKYVAKNHPDMLEDFNPNSDNQLRKIIFGDPSSVPKLVFSPEEQEVYATVGSKKKVDRLLNEAHSAVLARPSILAAIRNDELSDKHFVKHVKKELMADFGEAVDRLLLDYTKVYVKGEVAPIVFTKKSHEPSVNKEVLSMMIADRPSKFLAALMMNKRASKLRSTFIDGIEKLLVTGTDESHGAINATGTVSGRPSAQLPNDFNRPKKARGIHLARPGYALFEFDFSQIELRVASCLSSDAALREACLAGDLHAQTAMFMFKLKSLAEVNKITHRQPAKILNFSVIYGATPFRIVAAFAAVGVHITIDEAEDLINNKYFGVYKDLKNWIDLQHDLASKAPWYVYTPFGTRFSTINTLSTEAETKAHALRQAVNVQVQGGASEVAQCCIYRIRKASKKRKLPIHFVSHVYDSAAFEVPLELVPRHIIEDPNFDTGTVSVVKPEDIGEFGQLCSEVVKMEYPAEVLNRIEYKIDMTYSRYWDGKADMLKAIDPDKGDAKQMTAWAFVNPDILEAATKKELEQLERDCVML